MKTFQWSRLMAVLTERPVEQKYQFPSTLLNLTIFVYQICKITFGEGASARLESILEHFVILEDLHIRVRNSKSESKNWETLRERGSITPSSLKRRRNQSSCLAAPVVSFEERHPTIPNVRFFAIPSTIATFYLQFRICCFLGTKCRRQYHRRQYPQTTQPPPPVQASRRRQEMSRFLFSRATLVLQLFNQAN